MTRELIEPNLHVVLIHAPLGLLVVGTVIEFFAPIFWRRSTFRAAGRWMILLGALSLVPVAASGLYAMVETNHVSEGEAPWVDVRAGSPIQGPAWEMMKQHVLFNAAGSAVLLFLVVIWLGSSDKIRAGLHLIFLLLLLAGVGTILAGAWRGGEMVYRHAVGMNVNTVDDFSKHDRLPGWREAESYVPPLELHVMLAGAAIAAGLAAIGATMRAGATAQAFVRQAPELSDIGYAFTPGARAPQYNVAAQLHAMDDAAMQLDVRRVPAGRFWLLAALLAIMALLAGWWTLAASSDLWTPKDLWNLVQQNAQAKEYRRIAHVAMAGGIVALMLFIGLIARMAAGRRVVIGFFSLILLAAVAAQGWLGMLMLMDTSLGSVWKFNVSASAPGVGPTTIPSTMHVPMTTTSTTENTIPTSTPAANGDAP